jgi:hypothetical protein
VAINEQGQIAGGGVDGPEPVGFHLTPVPRSLGDLNCDGEVSHEDLAMLLGAWGPCGAECPADIDGDGTVGILDFLLLLANWG